ncbi:MAG TPA: UDP-glucose 4-epimerase GalE [Nevskiales bacterium]|nr:UDP-glucose 4-epimerase GalE [Nevskiales bacterium]
MNILVCGGAGYIGCHMVRLLRARGYAVTVLDNLSTGHRQAVAGCELLQVDVRDTQALAQAFAGRRFDAVMHFCGKISVGESVEQPYEYYANNVTGTLNLLQTMRAHGVGRLVFSSTAAVYGQPQQDRITEDHPQAPINPYGVSKWLVERMLQDAVTAYGLDSVSLRYFNVAGASPLGGIGESHEPETHLIPNLLKAARGGDDGVQVYGDDYATPDGTCIRDYIHVDDLAEAHLLALDYLGRNPGAHAFNLGNGNGFSVLQVIEAARQVTGRPIPYRVAPRRAGDSPMLVADSGKARRELGWQPRYTDIGAIIETAWRWHCNQAF